MYCWLVRRDNFEVPQLIVMNVSPLPAPLLLPVSSRVGC